MTKERKKKQDEKRRTSTRNHDIYAHTTLYKLCEFKYITEIQMSFKNDQQRRHEKREERR